MLRHRQQGLFTCSSVDKTRLCCGCYPPSPVSLCLWAITDSQSETQWGWADRRDTYWFTLVRHYITAALSSGRSTVRPSPHVLSISSTELPKTLCGKQLELWLAAGHLQDLRSSFNLRHYLGCCCKDLLSSGDFLLSDTLLFSTSSSCHYVRKCFWAWLHCPLAICILLRPGSENSSWWSKMPVVQTPTLFVVLSSQSRQPGKIFTSQRVDVHMSV